MSKTKTWASSTLQPCVAVNKIAIPVEAPDRVLIVPWGTVQRGDGDHFVMDEAAAASVLAAHKAGGVDVVIDAEHSTHGTDIPKYRTLSGMAPAMGWVKSLEAVPGQGLFGQVEWTAVGATLIASKAYRYLSPVVLVDKKDGRVDSLLSVGLVNTPAIVGMPAIVNKDQTAGREGRGESEEPMDQIRKALGLADGADEAAVVVAINKLKAGADDGAGLRLTVCKALGVAETANHDSIAAGISGLKSSQANPRDFVPASEHTKAVERLTKLEGELSANKAAAFVAGGMKSGKIVASNKAMWERLYQAGPEQAEKDLEAAPVIAPPDGRVVTNAAPGGAAAGGGSERSAIINKAKADWASDPVEMGKLCSGGLRGFVNGELLANKQTKLSDEEAKTIAA